MNIERIKQMLVPLAFVLFPKLRPHAESIVTGFVNPSVDIVTTWNDRCGIAAYSGFLTTELRRYTKIRIIPIPSVSAFSPYFLVLGFRTGRAANLVHVQFAYGTFSTLKLNKRVLTLSAFLFYLGLSLGARHENHIITTFHDPHKMPKQSNSVASAYLKAQAFLMRFASDLFIVLNERNKKLLMSEYEVAESKIKMIEIGCLEHPILLDKNKCKKMLNLAGKIVLTIPGFVISDKGHDLVIKALPFLKENVVLLVAGGTRTEEDSVYLEKLKKLAKQTGVDTRVFFDDSYPIPSTVYNATDIALLPYKEASDSMMIRDLVSYRIPTITSDIPVFNNLKNAYDCLELFNIEVASNLIQKINSLLNDQKRQAELKANCEKMWRETKWSSIAKKHITVYLEALAAVPQETYRESRQKERLDWLKSQKDKACGYSLEIGCATGYVTNYTGVNVGLDLNQYRIRVAKQRYHQIDFIIGSAEFLPFRENAFSCILIPEILEHIPFTLVPSILAESKRASGEIFITLPNADKANYDKNIVENIEHLWFPTRATVKQLLPDCVINYSKEKDFMYIYCRKKA